MIDTELKTIFSVLASQYMPNRKPENNGGRPQNDREFLKQKFGLNDEDMEDIASEIDDSMDLNEKFDKLEELLEHKGFEKGLQHRDRGFNDPRGDQGLRP